MRSMLRASTLATLAVTFLSLGSSQGAFADGRSDWTGYAWQQIKIASCMASGAVLHCPAYHEKWDWKRNQWVDIAIALDLSSGDLHLTQRLTDRDRNDSDFVCVTALAMDAAGNNVIVHHQNWHMNPGGTEEQSFSYSSGALDQIATIHIGSKQCRNGARQDDALYARVLAGIHS
ncbi:MAG: hypothetical protein WBA73_15515 [Devosia sp.]